MRISTNRAELDQFIQAARNATGEHNGVPFALYPQAQMIAGVTGADGNLRLKLNLKGVTGAVDVEVGIDPDPQG